jgi:hypothetical protein
MLEVIIIFVFGLLIGMCTAAFLIALLNMDE